MMSIFRIPHSAFRAPHSALRTPQSAIRNPQSVLRIPHSQKIPFRITAEEDIPKTDYIFISAALTQSGEEGRRPFISENLISRQLKNCRPIR